MRMREEKRAKKRDNIAAGIYHAVISSVPDEVREVNAMFICLFAHLRDICVSWVHTLISQYARVCVCFICLGNI